MSKTAKLDCESEDQQIRFASPEGRIRADSRLVLSHTSTPNLIFLHRKTSISLTEHPVFAKSGGIIAPRGLGYKYSQSNKRYISETSPEKPKTPKKA